MVVKASSIFCWKPKSNLPPLLVRCEREGSILVTTMDERTDGRMDEYPTESRRASGRRVDAWYDEASTAERLLTAYGLRRRTRWYFDQCSDGAAASAIVAMVATTALMMMLLCTAWAPTTTNRLSTTTNLICVHQRNAYLARIG